MFNLAAHWIRRLWMAPVAWTILVTLLRTGGFLIVLPVTLRIIPSEELGLWFVFMSIAQLANFVEMGFSPTIGRFASYYLGGAQKVQGLGLSLASSGNESPNYPGLLGLIQTSRWLYRRIALILGATMLIGGGTWLYIFYPDSITQPKNALAFLFFAFGTTVSMLGYFWPGFLFGINKVRAYQRSFIVGLLLSYIVSIAGLLLGFGLFALAASQLVLGLYTRFSSYNLIKKELPLDQQDIQDVPWKDLWPMTWRTGLGGLAAYLSLPVTTLICAQVTDLETTASYGLSLQLATMLHGLSSAWLAVKYPAISMMRTQNRIAEIRTTVKRRMFLCVSTYIAGGIAAAMLCPFILYLLQTQTHFLPLPLLALLFMTVGIDFIVGLHVAILQTGNQTPYLAGMIFTGVLTVLFGYTAGAIWGIAAIILAPALAQSCYNLWTTPLRAWRSLSLPAGQAAL